MKSIVEEVIHEILKRLEIKTAVVIGEKQCKLEKLFLAVAENDDFDAVIIRNLSNKMLADLALGTICTKDENAVYRAFCENKDVYMIKDGIECLNGQNKAFNAIFRLYSEYLEKLERYGAVIFGNVITEKLAEKMHCNGAKKIYISKKDIITPLADDFMRKNNIIIDRR